ncbi:MAG: AgmX/PglI C-terminal domain-containing protein [Candidatus Latescibacteria bacterium]|nr:AgmX/PglI C-terminal domain-containing protein [Candidatus Latescibacterota bacterium]
MSTPKSNVSFPREFKKSGIEQVDWKLVSFGAIIFFLAFGSVSFFASLAEPEVDLERIAEMQKRVAQIAMPETPPEPPPPPPELEEAPVEVAEVQEEVPQVASTEQAPRPSRAQQRASSSGGGGGGTPSRAEARAKRGQARAAAAQALAQQGVWAQLTTKSGTGGAAAGNFGGNVADLESSLGQVGGVKRGGTSTFDGSGSGAGVGEGAVVGPAGGRSSRGGGGDGMDVGSLLGGGVGGGGATSLGGDGDGPGGGVDIDLGAIAGSGGGGAPRDDSRSGAALQKVMRQNLGPVRFCYQRELKLNPNLQGSLQLRLTIAPNGRVTKIDMVQDTVGSRNLARCVQGRIRSWRFEPATGTSIVPITLPFSPNA